MFGACVAGNAAPIPAVVVAAPSVAVHRAVPVDHAVLDVLVDVAVPAVLVLVEFIIC